MDCNDGHPYEKCDCTETKDPFDCNAYCCNPDSKPFECNAECCAEKSRGISNKKNVHFTCDIKVFDNCSQCSSSGICLCCKEKEYKEASSKKSKIVLVYDLPKAKFDDLSISKRDFVPKPILDRELPPWHPARTNRWRPLDVSSLKKSLYQRDYTPPVVMPRERSTKFEEECIYLTEKDFEEKSNKQYDPTPKYQVWRKTTSGPGETIEVCGKPHLPITEVHQSSKEDKSYQFEQTKYISEELHGPDCEKHCYSTPLKCHENQNSTNMTETTSARVASAALAIEKNHLQHVIKDTRFVPQVCSVQPVCGSKSSSEFNCKNEVVARQCSSSQEGGDCKDGFSFKKASPCFEPKGYSNYSDRHQDSFLPRNNESSESYNKASVCKSNSYEDCSGERSLHSSESENQRDESNPINQREFQELHHTDSEHINFTRKYNHECNEPHRRCEPTRYVRFKEDIKHSPSYDRSQLNDKNCAHPYETKGHGVALGPSLLGRVHGEAMKYVAVPACTKTHSEKFPENIRNQDQDCFTATSERARNFNGSNDVSRSESEESFEPSLRNQCPQFTVCEGRSSGQARWWKLGGGGNVKSI